MTDTVSPTGAESCDKNKSLLGTEKGLILMVCSDGNSYRIYSASLEDNFTPVASSAYISEANESVLTLNASMNSDDFAGLVYVSTINSPTVSPIRYMTWE